MALGFAPISANPLCGLLEILVPWSGPMLTGVVSVAPPAIFGAVVTPSLAGAIAVPTVVGRVQ
jgi:hypothetical protein